MEWWHYGPLVMAIIMFLLVGTICERRIEAAIRRIIDRRRALIPLMPPSVEYDDVACSTTDLLQFSTPPLMKTPSQITLGDCRKEMSALDDDPKLEVEMQNRKLIEDIAC